MDEEKLIESLLVDDFTPLTHELEKDETENERGSEE